MPLEQGKIIAGKYVLERPLGQGGMGEVWVARHLHLGRLFALKVMKKSAIESPDSRGRFEREARVAASLVSPYIAQVTDSGIEGNDLPYMVMELLEGEDLHRRIKREGRLPAATVARIAAQVGKALRLAHAADLVHRDLKPANIFMARQDDEEIAKVLDFGIAKVISGANTDYTVTGEMLGTAVFMSPEQLQNAKAVDCRADLWSFGVTLFRALTGEYPFPGPSYRYVLAAQQGDVPEPQRATALVPELPPAVDIFFERTFARDLAGRYPTAQAMVEGFCRALGVATAAGEAPAATPPVQEQSRLGMRLAYAPSSPPPAATPPAATPPAATPPPVAPPAPAWPASTPPPPAPRSVRPLARTLPIGSGESVPLPGIPGAEDPSDGASTVPRPRRAALGAQTALMAPGDGLPGAGPQPPPVGPMPQTHPVPVTGSHGMPAQHSPASAVARAHRFQSRTLALAIVALVAVVLVVVLVVRFTAS